MVVVVTFSNEVEYVVVPPDKTSPMKYGTGRISAPHLGQAQGSGKVYSALTYGLEESAFF